MWVRVDDSLLDHPKMHRAGAKLGKCGLARAVTLYMGGLCYAARNLTDGFLPRLAVETLRHVDVPLKVAETLVAVGLWEFADGGFQIHDYLLYQPTAAKVKEKRAKDRERKLQQDSARNKHGVVEESVRNPERTRWTGSGSYDLEKKEDCEISAPRVLLEPAESLRWFDKIYGIYPNKDRKFEANRAWNELAPDLPTAAAMFTDVQNRVSFGWKKYEKRFIPQLRNFIAERMWEDAQTGQLAPFEEDDPYVTFAKAWTCKTCGQVHEGTAAQMRAGECLRGKASA